MKIPVSNKTAMPMYVHGHMIPAGETRHIDEEFVPLHLRPAPAPAEPAPQPKDPIAELLAHTVKQITAALRDLPVEQLELARAAESAAETPRKSLLAALDEELLERATAPDKGAQE